MDGQRREALHHRRRREEHDRPMRRPGSGRDGHQFLRRQFAVGHHDDVRRVGGADRVGERFGRQAIIRVDDGGTGLGEQLRAPAPWRRRRRRACAVATARRAPPNAARRAQNRRSARR